jgi:hypothetical protein
MVCSRTRFIVAMNTQSLRPCLISTIKNHFVHKNQSMCSVHVRAHVCPGTICRTVNFSHPMYVCACLVCIWIVNMLFFTVPRWYMYVHVCWHEEDVCGEATLACVHLYTWLKRSPWLLRGDACACF